VTTRVTDTPAAAPDQALRHFEELLRFETDCWDVHESLTSHTPDFILVDVRDPGSFAKGHVPGAINIPHAKMTAAKMCEYPKEKTFVVYCAGPHCNGANKAAVRLARLGLPVKMMIGGITGWIDEGFTLTVSEQTRL
jgi:rhodanese-related sulfurtransferase